MNPNELFYNSTTKVIFAHDVNWQWPEDVRQISQQEASDFLRDGATLDASVKDMMGVDIVASAPVDPNAAAASDAASQSESDTSSSANLASQGAGIEGTAQGSQVGEAGNVDSSASTAETPSTLTGSTNSALGAGTLATNETSQETISGTGDPGNALAGGVQPVVTTSASTDEPHPAISHLRALRNKIVSGEAIIMADLLRLIQNIEESL